MQDIVPAYNHLPLNPADPLPSHFVFIFICMTSSVHERETEAQWTLDFSFPSPSRRRVLRGSREGAGDGQPPKPHLPTSHVLGSSFPVLPLFQRHFSISLSPLAYDSTLILASRSSAQQEPSPIALRKPPVTS